MPRSFPTLRGCLRLLALGGMVFASPLPAAEDANALPQSLPLSRYTKMLADSPFGKPADAPTPPPPPPEQLWTKDYFVSGIMTVAGKNHVLIVQRSDNQRFLVATGESNPQGLSVDSIRFGNTYRETTVLARKGTETGVLSFDQDAAGNRPVPQNSRPTLPVPSGARPMITPPPVKPIPPGALRPGGVAPPVATPPPYQRPGARPPAPAAGPTPMPIPRVVPQIRPGGRS